MRPGHRTTLEPAVWRYIRDVMRTSATLHIDPLVLTVQKTYSVFHFLPFQCSISSEAVLDIAGD
jgi:hypothetical protein